MITASVPYGVSYAHEDFAGTLSVSPEALSRYVYEIGMSAARHGVTKLVILNGHGGNIPTLQFAAQMINKEAHIFTCVDTGETSDRDVAELVVTRGDVHAGEIETSTSLATRPELVRMERARKFVPSFVSQYMHFGASRRVEWFSHTARISPSGVLGDPTKATPEKGRRIWDLMVRNLVSLLLQGESPIRGRFSHESKGSRSPRFTPNDDINTDYIISGRYKFKIDDMNELAKHVMEDIDRDFSSRVKSGDFCCRRTKLRLWIEQRAGTPRIEGCWRWSRDCEIVRQDLLQEFV